MRYIDLERKYFKRKKSLILFLEKKSFGFGLIFILVAGIYFHGFLFEQIKKVFLTPAVVFTYFFHLRPDLKSTDNITNILILGIPGGTHPGAKLSDTIILASVNQDSGNTLLTSIPRDLWVDSLQAKINAVYATTQDKNGLKLAKETVSRLLGVSVHYGLRIDFSGFVKAIDLVGGIEINLEQGFEDYKFPIPGKENDMCGYTPVEREIDGVKKIILVDVASQSAKPASDPFACRFEHISFAAGPQVMSGSTALKFVRSRTGTAGEGSDFARLRRQQKVLIVLKEKLTSASTIFDPVKVANLTSTFGNSVDTDIKTEELAEFAKLVKKIQAAKTTSFSLTSESDNALLYHPPNDNFGSYVLLPKGDNFEAIQKAVSLAIAAL